MTVLGYLLTAWLAGNVLLIGYLVVRDEIQEWQMRRHMKENRR